MFIALANLALAAPIDPAQLADSEESALALIRDCEQRSLACDVSRDDLGEAYVVRAAAAALLRGEVDQQAAANARYLVPERVLDWNDILGDTSGVTPDAHLKPWLDQPDEAPRWVPRTAPLEPLAPLPAEAQPTTTKQFPPMRPGGASRLRTQFRGGQQRAMVGVGVRHPFGGGWSVLGDADLDLGLYQYRLEDEYLGLRSRGGLLRVGFGRQWASAQGAFEAHAFLVGTTQAIAYRTYERLTDAGASPTAAEMGVGGGVGTNLWTRLVGPLGVQWNTRGEAVSHRPLTRPLDGRRDASDATSNTRTALFLNHGLDVLFAPREWPVRLGVGARLSQEYATRTATRWSSAPLAPQVTLDWVLE